jgi:acetyltransferase-like isoleucine patch superfamily enzyme
MMADVVIFGIGDYAEQAHYYLSTDSPHRVVGFSVTSEWRKESRFHDLPLVPFEEIDKAFPPSEVSFFLPMSGRRMNRDRERFYKEAKSKGYSLISYVSSRAILCDNKIGENCFIFEGANLQPFAEVGDDSIVWCQTHVGHHSLIGDHVFISAGVTVSGRCLLLPVGPRPDRCKRDAGRRHPCGAGERHHARHDAVGHLYGAAGAAPQSLVRRLQLSVGALARTLARNRRRR